MTFGENGEGGSDLEATWWSGEVSDAKGEAGDNWTVFAGGVGLIDGTPWAPSWDLAVCAMLSGARSLYAISQWGRDQGLEVVPNPGVHS